MHEFTSLALLSLLDCTDEQRKSFVDDVVTRMQNGEVSVSEVRQQISSTLALVEALLTDERYRALTKHYKGNEQEYTTHARTPDTCPIS